MTPSLFVRFLVLLGTLVCAPLFAQAGKAEIAGAIAAEKARGVALLAADVKALDAIMADDCRYTHSSGKVESKKDHIDTFVQGLRYERFITSGIHGHAVTPDVVVLNGRIEQRKGVGGNMTDLKLFFHSVWRREAGAWRLASLQTASTPAPRKS
jgi:ketosteroid isomerase-like protein